MNKNRVSIPVKIAFGIGQTAEGIKNCSIAVFLIFFYTNVLGLSGVLAGTALLIALCFDAVTDPLMGSISDSFKSRWGRRHPFMYGAALPMAFSFYFLFVPPDNLGQTGLFIWLTVFTVLTRGFMTVYSVPHMSMNAELTDNYGERTTLSALRVFFSMMGFMVVAVSMFTIFLKATPEFSKGQLNPAGYPPFALTSAILIVVTILYSAIGTHHTIPFLPQASKKTKPFSPGRFLDDLSRPARILPFRVMASGMAFYYIMYGSMQALSLYTFTYFWEFSSKQIGIILPMAILGIASGVPFSRKVARAVGEKKHAWIICALWSTFFISILFFLRLFHLLPPNGHPTLFLLVTASFFIGNMGYGIVLAMGTSILADLTDEHERVHYNRQEGLYYGAMSLIQKLSSGLGSFFAGVIADFSGLSGLGDQVMATPENLSRFGWTVAPAGVMITLISIQLIQKYDITRAKHAKTLQELAGRKMMELSND